MLNVYFFTDSHYDLMLTNEETWFITGRGYASLILDIYPFDT